MMGAVLFGFWRLKFCLGLGNWDLELLELPGYEDSRQIVRLLKVPRN